MKQTMAANKTKKALLPKLRFKEFSDLWGIKCLGELGSFMGGGTPSTSIEKFWTGEIPWISSSDIFEDNLHNINIHRFLNHEAISESATRIIPKNSVLLISRVGVGKLAINKFEICTSQDFSNFIPNKCHSYFIGYFLLARKNLLVNFSQGTSIKGFTTNDIKSLKVSIPTLPEQQKIAAFLSAVDEKIQQLTRKKELLAQYKKGVMQQLFPSTGSGRGSGKLRFKDSNGKAYPKWEERRLGDVTNIKMGQSPDSKSYNNQGIGMLLIQGNADIKNRVTDPRQWTSEPTKKCEIGDLILTVRAPVGSISKSIHAACIGRGVCAISNKNNSDVEYLYQFLLNYESKWRRIEQGSTFTAVNGDDINSIKITLPSLSEQQKIAKYLSSIDSKLEFVAKQITQTQTFKKGLLQQMFV